MTELDDNGWGNIHHAASRGYTKSITRFVASDPDNLELETADGTSSTPFLLAVSSGNQESVKCLVELGAKTAVINAHNQGALEVCVLKQHISLVEYFLHLDLHDLPVWKKLLGIVSSESDEEVEACGQCLRTLTHPDDRGVNEHSRELIQHKGIPVLLKVVASDVSDDAKVPTFDTILNLSAIAGAVDEMVAAGGISLFIQLLKSDHEQVLLFAARMVKIIGQSTNYADQEAQSKAIPALLSVIKTSSNAEVHVEVVESLGNIARCAGHHQTGIVQTHGAVENLVSLFDGCSNKSLLMSLTATIASIVDGNEQNQNAFVGQGVTGFIIVLTRLKPLELQLNAVDAIHKLAMANAQTQSTMLNEGADRLLLQLLKKSRTKSLLEKTGCAVWALAGDDVDIKKDVASGIGVHMLIEFLNSSSEHLHFIGSEGIGVLAQGPNNSKASIASSSGIYPLVRHLKSYKEHIVLSVIRTLRHLCVGIGYVPQTANQLSISHSNGIHILVALMVHSRDKLIQVEAALTLSIVALGNEALLDEIKHNDDFSYVRVLRLLYSDEEMVRLLAGLAIATFSYNSVAEQKEIAELGGIRFDLFVPFLQSHNEMYRCLAAFQVVVLARIIPDEEQANSSAVGIKLLVDLIQDSSHDMICALAADCLARLAHTRAGIPGAITAIDAVNFLCELVISNPSDSVQGCSAIALVYLSHHHQAERALLNRCRVNPYIMKILRHYTSLYKLPAKFTEAWLHYKRIGLPPIPEGKVSLMSPRPGDTQPKECSSSARTDTRTSSNLPSCETHLNLAGEGRTSRYSRASRLTVRSSIVGKSSPTTSARLTVSNQGSQMNLFPEIAAPTQDCV